MESQTRSDTLDPASAAPRSSIVLAVTAAAVVLGGLKRLTFPGSIDFPLGEGGLFVLFSEAIRAAGFALPSTVTFGGQVLPFAYPPAGFYLAALAAEVSGADLLTIYHVVPRVLNLLAIPIFCVFAARLTRNTIVFAAASVFYALMPDSLVWQITGGGMPRALAALSALGALAAAVPLSEGRRDGRLVLGTGLLVGLAILSHIEWGLFAALGVTLLVGLRLPERRVAVLLPAIGTVSFFVILPWLALVLARHGLAPFLSSMTGSDWSLGQSARRVLGASIFASTLTIPAFVGALRLLRARDTFLPLWLPIVFLSTPRMAQSSGLAIPTALLAGYGILTIAELGGAARSGTLWRRLPGPIGRIGPVAAVAIAAGLFFSATLVSKAQWWFTGREQVEQVDRATRDAMAWIKVHTPAGSRFAVVTPAPFWFFDRIAEWFPYLTGRESLTTAQALEWAGPGVFTARLDEIRQLKAVQFSAAALLPTYKDVCRADHVAVFLPMADEVTRAFARSGRYEVLHATAAATVLRRTEPCPAEGG